MATTSKKICKHCDPVDRHPLHLSERIENLLFLVLYIFILPGRLIYNKFPNFLSNFSKIFLYSFFKLLLAIQILKEVDALDEDESLYNRTLVIVREARKRGFSVKSLKFLGKKSTKLFSIEINGKKMFFEGLPTVDIAQESKLDFDDKYELKKVLQSNEFPHAEGGCFKNVKSALLFAREFGFPLVVKPRSGSLSKHTTCDIRDEEMLKKAMRIAKMISREFVVEKFIDGYVYRITLVNHNVVACCMREAPNIIGDGIHTIKELIEIKNKHPLRGEVYKKNFTLHKIAITENTLSLLLAQGFTFKSILQKGHKVYLHNKVILGCGADIHDRTEELHPDNKLLFQKLSYLCGAPLIGVDFICRDISQPYHQQKCAIIEVNSLPYIDMHHYPVSGTARNVAGSIIDYITSIEK